MMIFLVILAGIVLILIEKYGTPKALEDLRYRGSIDRVLAEPEETVTITSAIENHSRLPLPFIRFQLRFPAQATPIGNAQWLRRHKKDAFSGWYTEEKLALSGRQSSKRTLSFSLRDRGSYTIGQTRLAAGDLLGFHEIAAEQDGYRIVIMPRRCTDPLPLQALGGFLGDLSVRRFIMEDPILTVGFRDYTGQEPLKAISWTRTAVSGSLQVKQFDHTAEQTAVVLLDMSDGSDDELEACYRITRSVCEALEKQKIPYSFRTNGHLPGVAGNLAFLPEGLGKTHLNAILYGLGSTNSVCFFSRKQLIRQALDARKANDAYILITPASSDAGFEGIRLLESFSGNPVCVLRGRKEENP